jgi:hypothetical protein
MVSAATLGNVEGKAKIVCVGADVLGVLFLGGACINFCGQAHLKGYLCWHKKEVLNF